MTLDACPETAVSILQWNVPWIPRYVVCTGTYLEYIMVEKFGSNFRIELYDKIFLTHSFMMLDTHKVTDAHRKQWN